MWSESIWYIKPIYGVILIFLISSCKTVKTSISGGQSESISQQQLDELFSLGADQYNFLASRLPRDSFPKTYEDDTLRVSSSGWWCSGFYPGTLLYLYEETKDQDLMNEAVRIMDVLEKEKHNTYTHDLGFMMFCSFGNAYRITGKEEYKEVIRTSANSLMTRFNPKVGSILSWDPAPWNARWQYPVIIDNMMNLELLLWSGQEFQDSSYIEVAIQHANTTIENHFREDNSSYHVVSYDTLTGEVEKKQTAQGYADESPWARGQAWGLYGFTVMYRFTKDQKYLDQAIKIADYILQHPNLPEDKVPYWDFEAPNIPDVKRDASAGAIMASALLELQEYVDQSKQEAYQQAAETMLTTLSGPEYLSEPKENGGFILEHSVGSIPGGTEVDVPITYADYYYVEALKRYQEIK